ncbi:hypothetical protein CDL15_Pgr001503 [Punica granatum]|nr:hypothetical protein CDL15_Pgr001503 [Punica granatum]
MSTTFCGAADATRRKTDRANLMRSQRLHNEEEGIATRRKTNRSPLFFVPLHRSQIDKLQLGKATGRKRGKIPKRKVGAF